MKKYILPLLALTTSLLSFNAISANSGTIHFTGQIVESDCEKSFNQQLGYYGCSKDISLLEKNKKEEKPNYENMIKLKNFPKEYGVAKSFEIEGNKVLVTRIKNEKYQNLYMMDILVK